MSSGDQTAVRGARLLLFSEGAMIYLETPHSDQHYFFLFYALPPLYSVTAALFDGRINLCREMPSSSGSERSGGGGTGEEFICVGAASIC